MSTGKVASGFYAWLRGQINRPDHVGNLAFEARRDPNWPREADGPGAVKRYLLEERGIYGQKIYAAVNEAWKRFDNEEVEDWKSPGGWLYELIRVENEPWLRHAMEVHGIDDPDLIDVGDDGEVTIREW